MATLASLRTTTQTLLQDASAARWSTTDIDAYLNEGQLEFNRLTHLFKDVFTFTNSVSNTGFTLVSSLGADSNGVIGPILRVYSANSDIIPEVISGQMDLLGPADWGGVPTGVGEVPSYWMRDSRSYNTILFYPVPEGATANGAVALAAAMPLTMTSSGTPVGTSIPEQYTYVLPHYAAYKCHTRSADDADLTQAAFHKAKFDEIVKQAQLESGMVM